MLTLVQQFLLENLWLIGQMAPYLILGFVFAGLLNAYVPRRAVVRHLGSETTGAALRAAVVGVPMPLCSCGVVPTAIGLRKRGASRAAVVSFLISTPQTGLDSIFATYGFFGWVFAIFRPVAAFLSGILGGMATLLIKQNSADEAHWLRYHVQAEDALAKDRKPQSWAEKLVRGMRFAFIELLGDIALWLVIGVAIAAAISMLIPDDFLASKIPSGIVQMLVMMVFGIPLYVCSTASIPIAAVLMTKGISAGAAFVFLMTGPATNAATMFIIGRVMGKRVLMTYLASIALLALGFGLGLDFLTAHTPLSVNMVVPDEHMLPDWVTWGSAGLLTFFIALHFINVLDRRFFRRKPVTADQNSLDLHIEGMTCTHCVRTVTEALKSAPGVQDVTVTLATGHARVTGDGLDKDQLKNVVEGVGYKVKE
ncbi:MAG: SO_0444 family Cu/Zn efflux transporter [Calditrichota bacterium]